VIETRYLVLVIAGLTAVSAANRSFFFLSRRDLPMPSALERGLRYAPVGALIAVVAPEIVVVDGQLIASPWDAHLLSALAATGYAALRKRDMLGTILLGMAVYLTLHLAWGW
jgi:branched-subunit amino acid transport protein